MHGIFHISNNSAVRFIKLQLSFVKGKLNSGGYIDFLQKNDIFTSLNNFYGEKKYFLEQDGAPCHR